MSEESRLDPFPPSELGRIFSEAIPALRPAIDAYATGDRQKGRELLLVYYRTLGNSSEGRVESPREANDHYAPLPIMEKARDLSHHIFDMGFDQTPVAMGSHIDWSSNPVNDAEWAARLHRFDWYEHLLEAYEASADDSHISTLMELTDDWILNNPIYTPHVARILPWLDIQVGVRSERLAAAFPRFITSRKITPEFLERFLASVCDHGKKTSLYPRLAGHNKTIIEACGLIRLSVAFPEFRDSELWLSRGMEILESAVDDQVNEEGIHNEWTPSYHLGLAGLISRTVAIIRNAGRKPTQTLVKKNELMYRYVLALSSPVGTLPMFGDTKRIELKHTFRQASALFDDPSFTAVADGQSINYPPFRSRSFPISGMYIMRSGWDPDSIYLALHCSPPSKGTHNQRDNGTFEIYGFGACLTPDSGSYSYPNTPHADERDWFRRTAAHQTLTINGINSADNPIHRLWVTDDSFDALVIDNRSYRDVIHRRTIFFIEHRYFVFIDEAIHTDDAISKDGDQIIELHFQFAPGPTVVRGEHHFAYTEFPNGANLLVWQPAEDPVTLVEEPGQVSYRLNEKFERKAIAFRHESAAPARFLTVIVPFRNSRIPDVEGEIRQTDDESGIAIGADRFEADITVDGKTWRIKRDVDSGSASCTR